MRRIALVIAIVGIVGLVSVAVAAGDSTLTAEPSGLGGENTVLTPTAFLPLVMNNYVVPPPPVPYRYQLGWSTQWYSSTAYGQPQDRLSSRGTWETLADNPDGVMPRPEDIWHILNGELVTVSLGPGETLFVATGHLVVDHALTETWQEGNIYLTLVRGYDPGQFPKATRAVTLTGYAAGAGIYVKLVAGRYIDLGWFLDQVTGGGNPPNCGNGCTNATVVLVDTMTGTYRDWTVSPATPRTWHAVPVPTQ